MLRLGVSRVEGTEGGRGQWEGESSEGSDGRRNKAGSNKSWRKLCRWLCSCTIHSLDRGEPLLPIRVSPRVAQWQQQQGRPCRFGLICSCGTQKARKRLRAHDTSSLFQDLCVDCQVLCAARDLHALRSGGQVNGSQGRWTRTDDRIIT